MKLSIQLIGALLLFALLNAPLEAKTVFSYPAPDNVCAPPGTPVVSGITSISAVITWTTPVGGGATGYEWQIGLPGFLPGTPGALFSGTEPDTSVTALGLGSNLLYEVYVRSVCPDNMFSDWIGATIFQTAPGCGDQLFDSGGESGDYQNGEKTITVICPNLPGTVVTLDFTQFVLADGDTLHVFNGTSLNDFLLNSYDQNSAAPFSLTSSHPSGCLTVQFNSDLEKVDAGYTADIVCEIPTECFEVVEINVFNLTATSANFSWPAVFGALGYEWELKNLQTMVTSSGITLTNTLQISGLGEANFYRFRVRTVCLLTGESDWQEIEFFTPINCANKPVLQCGPTTTSGPISATGPGIWDTNACGNTTPTPGKERIFRFTAPHTRMYTFQTIGGSSPGNSYVTYAYKESIEGCGPFDWNCIGSFLVSANGLTTTFGPLIAGKEYLILFDAETTTFVQHSFRIKDCGPPNDEARNAITLALDSPCIGNIYSNAQSTFNNIVDTLGIEPDPDVEVGGDDQVSGRWLTPADETVWFKFKSPLSGSVIISTESIPQGGNFDTQLALYEAVDSAQYPTFRLIASDDDNGSFGLGYNSVFSYSGLTPNANYYIQVDGYGSIINGNFCIEVKEGVIRTNESECVTPGYFAEDVDGTVPGGDHWYDIYTRPDDLDLGDLVIAVKPGFQDLDTVYARISVADTTPVSANHIPYLPAYVSIRSTSTHIEPFLVRLFFHQYEFDALVAESNLDPETTTIDQLVATHYSGPNEDCFQRNNSYVDPGPGTGIPTLINDIKAVRMGLSNMFYIEFQMPGNGEIGVHLQQTVLPVELKSFTGKIVDAVNRLEWTTETEKNVAWHMLERSADGIHWNEINRQAGKADAQLPSDYSFDDTRPLQKSFYRLRSLDYDGQAVLSSIVVLTRQETLGIDRVFPSPTSDRLNVSFSTPDERDIYLRVSDITGKIVLETSIFAPKGHNNTALSLQDLPAGVYIVSLSDGSSVVTPVRIVKQ